MFKRGEQATEDDEARTRLRQCAYGLTGLGVVGACYYAYQRMKTEESATAAAPALGLTPPRVPLTGGNIQELLERVRAQPGGGPLNTNPALQAEVEESLQCSICLDAAKTVAFGCGHMCCSRCAEQLQNCHMCRAPIIQKINLYG